ncbi:pentapeptide repeat-containing protein [Synechococcus sp. M16CYN]|uniref:pentapeptide repeat-containing protein n=1 Tax=Synechococcus sp. M16CYN TaxID=3103139 RepID=UPI003255E851
MDTAAIRHSFLRSMMVLSLALHLWILPTSAFALDTSAGFGLQDRALFQEKVDYTLTNQSNRDFRGQNLANTSFAGVIGRGADFRDANLHGAIFTQGAFTEADFRGADLSDALMDRADFVAADLRNAILSGVIASGSSFSRAKIEGADFSDALLDADDQRRFCRDADGINPITNVPTFDSLSC